MAGTENLVIPVLSAGFELTPEKERPDYADLSEAELCEDFTRQFTGIIPRPEELPVPGKQLPCEEGDLTLDDRMLHLKYAPFAFVELGRRSIGLASLHNRELTVPVSIRMQGSMGEIPGMQPIPVKFIAEERYLEEELISQNVAILYGDIGQFGLADMRREASRRAYGVGIEVLKAVISGNLFTYRAC